MHALHMLQCFERAGLRARHCGYRKRHKVRSGRTHLPNLHVLHSMQGLKRMPSYSNICTISLWFARVTRPGLDHQAAKKLKYVMQAKKTSRVLGQMASEPDTQHMQSLDVPIPGLQ